MQVEEVVRQILANAGVEATDEVVKEIVERAGDDVKKAIKEAKIYAKTANLPRIKGIVVGIRTRDPTLPYVRQVLARFNAGEVDQLIQEGCIATDDEGNVIYDENGQPVILDNRPDSPNYGKPVRSYTIYHIALATDEGIVEVMTTRAIEDLKPGMKIEVAVLQNGWISSRVPPKILGYAMKDELVNALKDHTITIEEATKLAGQRKLAIVEGFVTALIPGGVRMSDYETGLDELVVYYDYCNDEPNEGDDVIAVGYVTQSRKYNNYVLNGSLIVLK